MCCPRCAYAGFTCVSAQVSHVSVLWILWIPMDFYGFLWIPIDFLWIPIDFLWFLCFLGFPHYDGTMTARRFHMCQCYGRYEGNVGIVEMSICNFTGLVFGPYHLECLARLDVDAF